MSSTTRAANVCGSSERCRTAPRPRRALGARNALGFLSATKKLVLVVLAACHPDPSTTPPAPSSPTAPAPVAAPSPERERTCEPPANCGVWLECQSFQRIDAGRWRAETGPWKGAVFVREHLCVPEDAGTSGCLVYCTGDGAAPRCVDALVTEEETCTGHAVPRPAPFACEQRGGECVRAGR